MTPHRWPVGAASSALIVAGCVAYRVGTGRAPWDLRLAYGVVATLLILGLELVATHRGRPPPLAFRFGLALVLAFELSGSGAFVVWLNRLEHLCAFAALASILVVAFESWHRRDATGGELLASGLLASLAGVANEGIEFALKTRTALVDRESLTDLGVNTVAIVVVLLAFGLRRRGG